MSIRIPTQTVLTVNTTDIGAGSVAGGYAFPFLVPQDTDNIVVKFQASVITGGMSATLQTSDDGGTTYYDVARTSTVSSANATTAQWISAPVISSGVNPRTTFAGASIIGGTIGSAAASTLASGAISGLPILGQQNRLFIISSGGITVSSVVATVKVNSQSKY